MTTAGWPQRVMLAVWLMLVAYSLLAVAILPPVVPDVLRYHLPMGVRWMQEGRIGV
ncbi:MAG: hypothetical protein GTN84_04160, partial [Hydrogenophaga sp.]|nr:hypothetical protein [Hydrogenophaga sp.]NIN54542.1 hypothetical protein [Hydrogenophaga sp.]NIO50756.1 hypothetical protein [Hydrogenophaga sp.]NIO88987.1 hypothetical protein [Hydrogenophaga sp.]NIQ45482.1 hypothetical protein [Hydrogenophaga sp.]